MSYGLQVVSYKAQTFLKQLTLFLDHFGMYVCMYVCHVAQFELVIRQDWRSTEQDFLSVTLELAT
jgi:hypothetical protein